MLVSPAYVATRTRWAQPNRSASLGSEQQLGKQTLCRLSYSRSGVCSDPADSDEPDHVKSNRAAPRAYSGDVQVACPRLLEWFDRLHSVLNPLATSASTSSPSPVNLRAANLSPRTIQSYGESVRALASYLTEHGAQLRGSERFLCA